jgi:hypothetical protein
VEFMMSGLASLWRRYQQSGRLTRECMIFGLCLVLGWLLIPAAIYLVGMRLLGPYEHGGYLQFVADIAGGVFSGSWPFWLLVSGPYLGLWAQRLWRRAWH